MDNDDAALLALEREAASGGGDGSDYDMDAEMAREEAHLNKLLSDPHYALRMAQEAAMDDGDGGHGGAIDDADVMDELAELEGQVRGEGGSAAHSRRGSTSHANGRGSELDEDALLAEAEAEADQLAEEEEAAARRQQQQQQQKQQQQPSQPPQPQKPAPPPRSQQQQVTASASTLTAPAPSAAAAAAAASPAAEIASLTAQLQDLKRKAVEFKQAGNQSQAIEVLRNYKTVQARITELTKQASAPAPPAAAAPAHPAAAPANAAPAIAAAKPAVPSRPTPAAAAAAVAAVSSAATAVPSSARPTIPVSAAPSSSSSPGPKLSVRDNLEYDDLLSKLDAQIASLTASMKAVVEGTGGSGGAVVAGSKNAKLLALQYFRAKTRSTKDRDLVLLARSRLLRPPQTHLEELAVQQELCFPELGDDEVCVVVERGTDLHNRGATGDPKDLSTYVSMFVEYAVDMEGNYRAAGAHSTPIAKQKGPAPNWSHTQRLALPISRTGGSKQDKTGLKRLLRSRLVFQVYHKRFLLGSIELGRAEVRLKEMSLRSELRLALKLKDNKTAERTGELHVVVRLRRPFEGIDLRENKLSLIIVDEFEDGAAATTAPAHAPAPAPAAAHTPAPPAVAAAAVAASPPVSASAPPVAAAPSSSAGVSAAVGVPAVDLSDPHDVVKMRSNDVLEAEVAALQTQLAQLGAHPDRAEEADALRDRLTAAQVQLQVLVTQVQHGKLSLEEYLAGLRSSIASESALAIALGRAARKEDAIRVLQRVKIMKAELQNAEENQEELEQC